MRPPRKAIVAAPIAPASLPSAAVTIVVEPGGTIVDRASTSGLDLVGDERAGARHAAAERDHARGSRTPRCWRGRSPNRRSSCARPPGRDRRPACAARRIAFEPSFSLGPRRAACCAERTARARARGGSSPSRTLRFEAADLPAAADEAVGGRIWWWPTSPARRGRPTSSLAAGDDPAADPRTEREQHEVRHALARRRTCARRASRSARRCRRIPDSLNVCANVLAERDVASSRNSASSGSSRSRDRCSPARRCRSRRPASLWRRRALHRHFVDARERPRRASDRRCRARASAGSSPVSSTTVAMTCEPPRSTPIACPMRRPFAQGPGRSAVARERTVHARDDRSDRPSRAAQPSPIHARHRAAHHHRTTRSRHR